jgi:plasmid stability protein
MERTTISIPDDLRKRLRIIAAERGTSMATVIREALEAKVKQQRPKPRSIGIGDSGYTDTSQRVDELLEVPEWRSS